MEAIAFTLAGIVLYIASDRILCTVERRVGRRLEHRTLVFFAIILTLALATFWLVRRVLGPG